MHKFSKPPNYFSIKKFINFNDYIKTKNSSSTREIRVRKGTRSVEELGKASTTILSSSADSFYRGISQRMICYAEIISS